MNLDNFAQQIQDLRSRVASLQLCTSESRSLQQLQEVMATAFLEISTALEELQVACSNSPPIENIDEAAGEAGGEFLPDFSSPVSPAGVTEDKQALSALPESEARFRSVFEQAGVGVAQVGIQGEWLLVNQQLCNLVGYTREELLGLKFQDITHPEDLVVSQQSVRSLLANEKQALSLEKRFIHKQGAVIWVNVTTTLVREKSGEPEFLITVVQDISDRKLAEEKLRKSEANLAEAQKLAHLGSWEFDVTTQVISWSQEVFRIFGFDRDRPEPTRREHLQQIHPGDRKVWQKTVQQAIREGKSYELEFRILQPDGSIKHVYGRGQAVTNAQGQVIRLFGTVQDITYRVQAESALRENEALYRLLAENSTDMISRHTPEGVYLYASPACRTLLGYEPEELVGRSAYEFFHPEDVAAVQKSHATISEQQDTYTIAYRIRRKDGKYIWLESTCKIVCAPYMDAVQEIISVSGNITERQLVELALREGEERFRLVFQDAPIGISLCTLDGKFVQVNPAFCQILGYSESELNDLTFQELTHPEDLAKQMPYLQKYLAGEITRYQIQKRYIKNNGFVVWVNLTSTLVEDQQGKRRYALSMVEDITDRKQAEEEVIKALAKEKELSSLKSRFVTMTSHEFRTPLTIIKSSAQLLQRYEWSKEEQLEQLMQIQSAVKHMTELLEDVLTIGKAEAGKLEFNPAPVELTQFCRRFVSQIQHSLGSEHHIKFVVEAEARGTPHDQLIHAHMDEKLLRQIFGNLLSNAIKYSHPGSFIKFILRYDDDRAVFHIQDQGIGFPPEDQSRLFESFYRATNVGTIHGTGLGLAIVKKCVALQGGTITVTSQVGIGTTFQVTLPLRSQAQN